MRLHLFSLRNSDLFQGRASDINRLLSKIYASFDEL